jgi:hypothetical protein
MQASLDLLRRLTGRKGRYIKRIMADRSSTKRDELLLISAKGKILGAKLDEGSVNDLLLRKWIARSESSSRSHISIYRVTAAGIAIMKFDLSNRQ